jgi:hypothetical protein
VDIAIKEKFLKLWKKYFSNAELPITFYFADEPGTAKAVKAGEAARCVIGALTKVRNGESLALDVNAVGCPGGRKYLGFTEMEMPDFEYFLSCGIPGKLEGERYKKTPEMVREYMTRHVSNMEAPGKYIIFKRWDNLAVDDEPEVVIFYARPDVLSGLFTLASFDEVKQDMMIAPFGSGCASIVQYPYLEKDKDCPRSVIGMFDVSARPYVPEDALTFAAPLSKVIRMIDNMDESFLITPSWKKVQERIK